MSSLIGETTAGKAGLPTFLTEGRAEEKVDAKSADVLNQGAVIFRDVANVTPAERVFKMPGTGGGQVGEAALVTKTKIAGETKVTVIKGTGMRGTAIADSDIEPDALVEFGTVTDGRVKQAAVQTLAGPGFARYRYRYKYANDGDGNHAKVKAVVGDVIVIEFL